MKKYFLIMTLLVLTPTMALAATRYNTGDNIILSAAETVEGNYFAAGQDVVIAGTVTGDLYAAGAVIDIKGTVEGDVFAAAETVLVTGDVKGSLRSAGSVINIMGKVDRNVTVAAESLTIGDTGEVAGELLGFAARGRFFGPVGGTVEGFFASLLFGSSVGRDIEVTIDSDSGPGLEFLDGATVSGDLIYKSRKEIEVPEGVVAGQVDYSFLKQVSKKQLATDFGAGGWWFSKLIYLFGLMIIGLLMINLMKRKAWEVADNMKKSIGLNMLIGLVGLIVVPIVIILLLITVVGIPLGLLLLFAYIFSFYLFAVFTSMFLGRWLKMKFNWQIKSEHLQLLIGTIVFVIMVSLPYVGGWIYFLSLLWTTGALYRMKKDTIKEWKK